MTTISLWLLGRPQVEQYGNFFDHLEGIKRGVGEKYRSKKPLLAEELSPHFTKENLSSVLDLTEKLDAVCDTIRKWNSL